MLWAFERLFWEPAKVEMEARLQRDENEGVDEDAAGAMCARRSGRPRR